MRTFEPKREDKILHNEEPDNLFTSQNIIKVIKSKITRLPGQAARIRRNTRKDRFKDVVEGCKWEDNIKRIFKKLCQGVVWINLAQDRDRWRAGINTVINSGVPKR